MRAILCAGPYMLNYWPLILKPWTPDFYFNGEFPTEIPLWVKLPNLPMNYWGANSLSRISSIIGKPIYADECTAKKIRIFYACLLIEVNVTKEIHDTITIADPNGRVLSQPVVYN